VIKKTLRLNKMSCDNPQCFVMKDIVFSSHDLAFVNKKQKYYKIKFSTNLILKKLDKDNFGRKKPIRKNVVAIDNVL